MAEGGRHPKSLTLRVLGVNVAAYYSRDTYTARLPKLGKLRKDTAADVVLVTESGTYDNGAALSKAFGFNGVRADSGDPVASFVLHGPSMPITRAVHWAPGIELLAEDQFDTVPGTTHNGATWALLRSGGVLFLVVVTHLQYLPKGANSTKTQYDTERQQQLAATFARADDLAAGFATQYGVARVPVIVGEDFNGTRTDAYDGPGKAMAAAGYRDVERAKLAGTDSAIIDRFAVSAGVVVNRYVPAPTNGGSDHRFAVLADLTLSN